MVKFNVSIQYLLIQNISIVLYNLVRSQICTYDGVNIQQNTIISVSQATPGVCKESYVVSSLSTVILI